MELGTDSNIYKKLTFESGDLQQAVPAFLSETVQGLAQALHTLCGLLIIQL